MSLPISVADIIPEYTADPAGCSPDRLSLQLEPHAQSPAQSSSSRESAEERERLTAAAVPPSPARQAALQAHRRACSLGVK